ncbi:hypothetical protein PsorP6_014017 [Peronosclerospora sorghi]|uniref:Uncharacterized protein n=1 Tax=Peronosclerospora sorghi TaxID=230839 RepID=A0ACC0VJH9_9STRA|nr:hypothetical protein PsorP6_014017 [Peronosclerospora sorghi]
MEDQRRLAAKYTEEEATNCSGTFRATMGLPCSHEIYHMENPSRGMSIPLSDVHPQWLLIRDNPLPPPPPTPCVEDILADIGSQHSQFPAHQQQLQEDTLQALSHQPALDNAVRPPDVVRGKGRPKRSLNKRKTGENTTRRDPSGFGIAEATAARKTTAVSQLLAVRTQHKDL